MKIEIIRQIGLSLDEEEWETVLNGLSKLSNNSDYEVPPDMQHTAARMHAEIVEELHKFNQR